VQSSSNPAILLGLQACAYSLFATNSIFSKLGYVNENVCRVILQLVPRAKWMELNFSERGSDSYDS